MMRFMRKCLVYLIQVNLVIAITVIMAEPTKPFHKMNISELIDELSSRGVTTEGKSKDELMLDLYSHEIHSGMSQKGVTDNGSDSEGGDQSTFKLDESKMHFEFLKEEKAKDRRKRKDQACSL